MITERVLDIAVEKGLIERGQAMALRSLARQEAALSPRRPEPVDEERLRFVTGFADIFVTIGLGLFLGSAAYLVGRSLPDAATAAIVAVLAWGLAEFFTGYKRMALPSIALLVVFCLASFLALGGVLGGRAEASGMRLGWLGVLFQAHRDPLPVSLAGFGTALLASLHYWRFRVPITVAAGTAAIAITLFGLLFAALPAFTAGHINGVLLAVGLGVFALAMRFDLSDPERVSRRTDIAFWLHLLASPLIVHSVFQQIGAGRGLVAPGTASGIIAVFLALAAVAVLVDRRAMLVSGLVYTGIAFGSLIARIGVAENTGLPVTLLALGAFVLVLSAGWTPLRRTILGALPAQLAVRLPRPGAA